MKASLLAAPTLMLKLVLVAPELIWAVNSHLELKAAVPFSLTTDGESIGVRVQATARF